MNALKTLNKEQWAAAIAVGFGVITVALSLTGGLGTGMEAPPTVSDRAFEPSPSRFAEFVDDRYDRYSVGKLFEVQAASKLPIPPLKAPEPREEDLAAPSFRPSPVTEVYNKLQVKSIKYPTFCSPPVIPEGDLPPQATLDELKKMEEPAQEKKVDRRNEREREWFTVYVRTSSDGRPKMGTLLFEDAARVIIINKDTKQRETYPRENITRLEYNRTNEEQYRLDSQKIQPGPKEADERVKLARRLVALGMLKEAREELALAQKARKDHLEATLLLVGLLVEVADFDGAIAACESALQAGAPAAELYAEIGKCHRALGFQEGALLAFERAVEASPRVQAGKLGLARMLLDLGQYKQAIAAANDFFSKLGGAPDTTPAHKAEAFLIRGLAEIQGGDLGAGRNDLEETRKIEPQNGEALNGLGAALALEGAYREAGLRFAEAIKGNQYVIEAWTNLGTLLLLGGKAAEADAIFRAAADRDPVSVEPVLGQALAAIVQGKKDALAGVERAVQLDPKSLSARQTLGWLKLRDGADDDALAAFTSALRLDTAYLPAYTGAAAAYLRTARRLGAEAMAQKDEARQTALTRLAQERRVNAETLLRQVRDFDGTRASSWIALGCAYASMGRSEEARNALRSAAASLQAAGKADPLISYALGFVEYHYGPGSDEDRLESAEREFSQGTKLKGQLTDPFSTRAIADCEQAVAEIETWRVTSIRLDERFERESSQSLGNNWLEQEDKYGLKITLENTKERGGRAKFSGKQAISAFGITSMTREIPGEFFYAFEGTLYPERVDRTEYGFSIFYSKQGESWVGFHVGVDLQGKVRYNVSASDPRDMDRRDMTSGGWIESKIALPNPKEITLRVVRAEKNRLPTFGIQFWDPGKGEWIQAVKDVTVNIGHPKGNWKVGAFCRAEVGADVLVTVDNIRVYERVPR